MPLVTVAVVPCKDEIRTLEACLLALRAQPDPPAYVVVVDNGSTDGSLAVAHAHADTVLHVTHGGIAHLRNAGARAALAHVPSAQAVAFVDADTEVAPDWLPTAAAALDAGADLVGSRTAASPNASWVARRWAAVEAATAHPGSLAWSQHLLLRRTHFEAVGGFDEQLATGEDGDLSARVRAGGGQVHLVPALRAVHHGFPATPRAFLRRELWHTRAPGWFARMSRTSQGLVLGAAAWSVAGLLSPAVRRGPALWLAGSAAAVPALGAAAGAGTGALERVQDGVLLGTWAAVRVARLPREAGHALRTRLNPSSTAAPSTAVQESDR